MDIEVRLAFDNSIFDGIIECFDIAREVLLNEFGNYGGIGGILAFVHDL
jgi:hypothetical protein